ncbi:kinase non-catalytic C-lobe domain-containing protein 1-like [Saccostrea echinata]|uniref:kinase non-catalytic C-lobe domain-containing protein 1-like n=1 Tax=Saccostrea echinata TaxID=191078 RepID=UPI002A81BBDF|nr:kinase non-catalytic C-lobe domain-containing protein 1-like [Saccostrea echinata]
MDVMEEVEYTQEYTQYDEEDDEELPPLNEGDEAISLYDILVERDKCLSEEELWALCRECCLVLEVVNNSPEMFQTLCVTPDTVAFDGAGNVCFLDLDRDPESLYIPPEYDNVGNSIKSHLFSLGMTLLYAAEYNGEPGQQICPELRELFGCMTSEHLDTRPDLESIITQCEEELCGKSSQEICCGIGGFAAPFTPAPDVSSITSYTDVTEGLANYLSSQSSIVPGVVSETLNRPQQHSTPSESPPQRQKETESSNSQEEEVENSDFTETDDMPMRGMLTGMPLPTGNRERKSNTRGPSKQGFNYSSNLISHNSIDKISKDINLNVSETSEISSDSRTSDSETKVTVTAEIKNRVSPEKPKPPLPRKPSLKEQVTKSNNDSGMIVDEESILCEKSNCVDNGGLFSTNTSKPGPVEIFSPKVSEPQSETSRDISSSSMKRTESSGTSSSETKPKRSKKKQGLTVNEVLDSLNRGLTEEELWALCREGTIALQRKKKHLPAYISPDTLVLRENGNLSFKAIPEDKPLEVIFMAPELQQRGNLSDKTCLYGLGVTLRCAGGNKYSPISAMSVSEEFQSLLEDLTKSDPAKRPSLEAAQQRCDNYEGVNSSTSNIVCKNLFTESFTKMMNGANNEEKEPDVAEESVPEKPVELPKSKPKPPPKPPSPMISAFRPIKGPITKPQIGSSSSMFAPVAVKPKNEGKGQMPSAFTSTATHFKPIILHKTSSSPAPPPEEEKKTEATKEESNDNDKEVVRKLKELKKNLMKHRQPVKDSEGEENQKEQQTTSVKSSNEKKESEENVQLKASNTGSLDNLLSELQKQGSVPDTQSLAAAIAQHLAKNLQGSQQSNTGQGKDVPQQSTIGRQGPMSTPAAPNMNQMFNMHLNQQMSNFPPQYQQQLMGQTMTLPSMGQFGGSMMPGYPMQVQLQQDPRTGLFQMVPVSMVTVNSAPGSQANSDEFNNMEDVTRMSDPGRSPKPRPRHLGGDSSRDLSKQKQGRHGRTAKDLVQKTANIRSKNLQQQNTSNISSPLGQKDYDSKQWSSNQGSDKLSSQTKAFNGESGQPSDQYNSLPRKHSVPLNLSSADYHLHPQSQRIRSNTSSPSPSKDSGVSGVNGVYKPPDPGSLMDRLLNSNTSLTQQQKMGRLVHLLREEFAFDGYMENGVEDINMAEYVMSLGSLKWETFSSAITEKYSDMYWKVDLLVSLFEAVNGIKPAILNQSHVPNKNVIQSNDTGSLKGSRFRHGDDPDGSSSSMSETNQEHSYRKQRVDKAFNRTGDRLGSRPQSVNALQENYDTSDSTDNENIGNRRRHRKKHFEKSKSSSMHNLASNATFTVVPDGDNVVDGDIHSNAQPVSAEDQNTHNVNRRLSLPQRGLSPHDSFHSNSGASHPGSHIQANNSSETLPKRKFKNDQDGPHLIHVQSQKSDISKHYRKNRGAEQGSLSSRSSSMSDVRGTTKLTRHMSQLSLSEEKQETLTPYRRNHILFHYAMMQLNMSKDLEKFLQDIDEENAERLQAQLANLDQQIMMERRTKRKTQAFFNRLTDSQKGAKDQKTTVSKDLEEMSQKIRYLQLCKNHIEMLQTELDSINSTFLYSLSSPVTEAPLRLKPQCDNPLLQFQTLREPQTGCEIQVVQAGTTEGLMSYLFASTALSFGFVHQFFFGFRYFANPVSLLDFLTSRFSAIARSKAREANLQRIQRRVVDLLHFWVEGFYPVDFEDNEDLINSLQFFIEEQNLASFSEEGKKLQELLALCMEGNSRDLLTSVTVGENVHVYKQNGSTKKWDSLKTVTPKSTSKDPVCMKSGFSVCLEKRRNSHHMEEVYFPKMARRTDAFTLADYTSQCIAEQLTLIEQGIFQMTHPVHYLNSKALGVSVALTMSGTRTPSILRLNNVEEQSLPGGNTLFESEICEDPAIQRMIDHSRDISHWVAAEIVSCSSSKSQVAVLTRFLHAAQLCKEMRNYASCLAIADGLENIIIKQLPAWKNLPSKSYAVMEELKSVRMFLKNDALSLMKHADCHLYPTIPSALLFLLHVQQQEIGSFKLANDMVKWSKIRTITQTIDQIRIFKDQVYGFEPDYEMQDTLMQRVREFSSQDIQSIASQHDTNYHKMPSGGGISAAFRKMKGKFQSK